MTAKGASRVDRDRLDEELDFLLRSLEDLDAERDRGGLSDRRYERLRAQYTARAAAVARATDGERTHAEERTPRRTPDRTGTRPTRRSMSGARPRRPSSTRRRRQRLLAVVAAVALAALGASGAVGLADNPPAAGQASTPAADPSLTALRQAVEKNPRSAAAHDALANGLAGTGDLAGALREFDTAASLDPADPVALAYSGWIALLADAPDKALTRLAQAEAVDPDYPDAHAFRGIALLRTGGDQAAAVEELQRYLKLAPDGPMTEQVHDVLDQLGQP